MRFLLVSLLILFGFSSESGATEISAHLSLSDRSLVVYGLPSGTTAFPVSVGGVDFNNKSLTPTMNGFLEKRYLIKERHVPDIFKGKPFIRISDFKRRWTAYGFHVKQSPILQRGYVSRGCIRMREKDLQELSKIVQQYTSVAITINWDKASVPVLYPPRVTYAMRYKNFGTKEHPVLKRDEKYNLAIMEAIGIPTNIRP